MRRFAFFFFIVAQSCFCHEVDCVKEVFYQGISHFSPEVKQIFSGRIQGFLDQVKKSEEPFVGNRRLNSAVAFQDKKWFSDLLDKFQDGLSSAMDQKAAQDCCQQIYNLRKDVLDYPFAEKKLSKNKFGVFQSVLTSGFGAKQVSKSTAVDLSALRGARKKWAPQLLKSLTKESPQEKVCQLEAVEQVQKGFYLPNLDLEALKQNQDIKKADFSPEKGCNFQILKRANQNQSHNSFKVLGIMYKAQRHSLASSPRVFSADKKNLQGAAVRKLPWTITSKNPFQAASLRNRPDSAAKAGKTQGIVQKHGVQSLTLKPIDSMRKTTPLEFSVFVSIVSMVVVRFSQAMRQVLLFLSVHQLPGNLTQRSPNHFLPAQEAKVA